MSPDPVELSARQSALSDLVPFVTIGSLLQSIVGGIGGAIAGMVLGGLGAHFGGKLSDLATSLAGVTATAASVVVPLGFARSVRPWRRMLGWMFAAGLLAFLVDSILPHERDWRLYRWALAGAAMGVLLGALYEPIALARGAELEEPHGEGKSLIVIGFLIAAVIRWINSGRPGNVVAGLIGGGLGGLAVGGILAGVAPDGTAELMGGGWVILVAVTGLGALGGGWGGWSACSAACARLDAEVAEIHA